jgi:hypothetical protein
LQDNSKGQGRSRRAGRKQKDDFEIRVNASDTIRSVKSQVCMNLSLPMRRLRCAVLINRAIKGHILWKANMRVAAGIKGGQNNGARKKSANKCTWYYSFDLRLFC